MPGEYSAHTLREAVARTDAAADEIRLGNALEELHGFVQQLNVEASHEGNPDAAIAMAKVMKRIREMQRRGA